jgi:methylmalonyl-CoA/ethylmalonyl-CoA epimerase
MTDEISPQGKALFNDFVQVGVVVRDIERSMKYLREVFGIGPFRVLQCPHPDWADEQHYYGQKVRYKTLQAFAELGPAELELIQPVEGKTIWSDFLERHGPGIHHIRFNVKELAPVLDHVQRHGIGITQQGAGTRAGTTWINFDTEALIGFIIEIMRVAPGTDGRTFRPPDSNPVPISRNG